VAQEAQLTASQYNVTCAHVNIHSKGELYRWREIP